MLLHSDQGENVNTGRQERNVVSAQVHRHCLTDMSVFTEAKTTSTNHKIIT